MLRNVALCAVIIVCAVCVSIWQAAPVWAHGVVGKRFFVESVSVEDPFPSDEMDLLGYSLQKNTDGSLSQAYSGGISKRLSPNLGFGVEWAYEVDKSPSASGFDNFAVHIKYNMVRIPEHEFLATAMVDYDIGKSGSKSIGESKSTVTPTLLFGYGLGDLPDALQFLRPFAITGQLGIANTVGDHNPDPTSTSLEYGMVVEYSLLYLQSFVKDVGIPWPLSRVVPMVEFTGEANINGDPLAHGGITAYPGATWAGRFYQMTVETIVPLNQNAGHDVGVQGLIHLYLDDMFPNTYTWTPFYGVLGGTQK